MKDKPITVEDYEKHSKEFLISISMLQRELGEGAKAEDILKIMESLGALVIKKRYEEKGVGPFGFNKNNDGNTDTTESDEC